MIEFLQVIIFIFLRVFNEIQHLADIHSGSVNRNIVALCGIGLEDDSTTADKENLNYTLVVIATSMYMLLWIW